MKHLPASRLGSPLSKYSGATILTNCEKSEIKGRRDSNTTDWNNTQNVHRLYQVNIFGRDKNYGQNMI